jgi:hypothetical protein
MSDVLTNTNPKSWTGGWLFRFQEASQAELFATKVRNYCAELADRDCVRNCFERIRTFVDKERWSHFLRQPAKVDSLMQRTNHHEDAQTVFG